MWVSNTSEVKLYLITNSYKVFIRILKIKKIYLIKSGFKNEIVTLDDLWEHPSFDEKFASS